MSVVGDNEGVNVPCDQGAPQQCLLPVSLHGIVGPVPNAGNVKSNVIKSLGWQKGGIGLTSSQAGQLSVQRYLDQAGTIPVGAAITAALTAATVAAVTWSDGLPFGSFQATVTNTSGTPANLTGITVMLQSN